MNSMMDSAVIIQTSSHAVSSTPSWFGEVVLLIEHLRQQGVLSTISERVRFSRRRFGQYEVIDFLAVLFGYAISGERTLEAFYQRLQPFAAPFMALFERDRLPARSTLSRFLTALTQEPVDALRNLFLDDLESRPLSNELQTGDLVDREGGARIVFDVDGTREAARQRALPQTEELPPACATIGRALCRLSTRDASEGTSCEPGPSSVRLTPRNGSAPLATQAMDATEPNCARRSSPVVAPWLPTTSRRRRPWCASMGNLARGR